MRIQVAAVEQAMNADGTPDGYAGQGGFIPSYKFEGYALDDVPGFQIRAGEYGYWKGNFKNPPRAGTTEDFEVKVSKTTGKKVSFPDGTTPDGNPLWRVLVARPKQGAGGGQMALPAAPGGAPRPAPAPARPVPTMSQAVAVLKECVAAVAGWGTPEHATTLFLARIRGEVKRDPSAEEVEAARLAAEAQARAAQEAAARRAAEAQAAAQAAAAAVPGYAATEATGDNIPF